MITHLIELKYLKAKKKNFRLKTKPIALTMVVFWMQLKHQSNKGANNILSAQKPNSHGKPDNFLRRDINLTQINYQHTFVSYKFNPTKENITFYELLYLFSLPLKLVLCNFSLLIKSLNTRPLNNSLFCVNSCSTRSHFKCN